MSFQRIFVAAFLDVAIKSHLGLDLFIKESFANTDYCQVRIAEILNQARAYNLTGTVIQFTWISLKLRLSQLIRITCLHNWL